MSSATPTDSALWLVANQRYLAAAVRVLACQLAQHAAADAGPDADAALAAAEHNLEAARTSLPAPARIDMLCLTCELSEFERSILLLCAGAEIDSKIAALCATLQGPEQPAPTFALALAALPDAHWSALLPTAPLRGLRLISATGGQGLSQAPLRIEERVLHHLIGLDYLDEQLDGSLQRCLAPSRLPASHEALMRRLGGFWKTLPAAGVVQLYGEDRPGAQAIAAAACAERGQLLYLLRASDLPRQPGERDELLALWRRESILSGSALLLDCTELATPEVTDAAMGFMQRCAGTLLLLTREPLTVSHAPCLRVEVTKPHHTEQSALWKEQLSRLGGSDEADSATTYQLVSHFNLGSAAIEAGVTSAAARLAAGQAPDLRTAMWIECRGQARVQLEGLARRIEPAAAWADLVLTDAAGRMLRQIAAQVRQRLRVYEQWGFAKKGQRGLGISALFAGPSGTGKTLAAEVLATELGLDLYHVDLSQMISKYIGETEKNLRRIFDAADAGGAILLFDEADALFGKRSEVKDSHDRYANIEVSYLLQRMEEYRGLAILTTNMKSALDDAFLRRLRFVIQFPFPDSTQRAAIWKRAFPEGTPRALLDPVQLARLPLTGGNIRNIALNAAFLAADSNRPVDMEHLIQAMQCEYDKLEKPFNAAELGGLR